MESPPPTQTLESQVAWDANEIKPFVKKVAHGLVPEPYLDIVLSNGESHHLILTIEGYSIHNNTYETIQAYLIENEPTYTKNFTHAVSAKLLENDE